MTWKPIDQDSTADDRSLGAAIPIDVERNLLDSWQTHHQGGTWAWRHDGSGTYPAYSSHPDYYFAIPLLLPAYAGAKTLEVDLLSDVALLGASAGTDAVRVRLMADGQVGSATTLTTGSDRSTALSVDLPSVASADRVVRAELRFQSIAGGGSTSQSVVIDETYQRCVYGYATGPTLTDGKVHYLLTTDAASLAGDDASGFNRYHVSRTDSTSRVIWVWPDPLEGALRAEPSATKNADVIDLGTIAPKSLAWRWTSDETFSSEADFFSPVRRVMGRGVSRMQRRARTMYLSRRRVFSTGSAQPEDPDTIGTTITSSSGGQVGGAHVLVDTERQGFRVVLCGMSKGTVTLADRTVTIYQYGDDGTELDSVTTAWDFEPAAGEGGFYTTVSFFEGDGGSMGRLNVALRDPALHGHGDAILAGEMLPEAAGNTRDAVALLGITVPWDSTLSTGDRVRVQVDVDDSAHVWCCLITEA